MLSLTEDNFSLGRQQNRKPTLLLQLPPNYSGQDTVVLFKMQNCPGCMDFYPHFKTLFQNDDRVNVAECDVTQNRRVIQMSRETDKLTIQTVPFVIYFSASGRPIAKFTGERTYNGLQAFVNKAIAASGGGGNGRGGGFVGNPQPTAMPQQSRGLYGGGGGGKIYQPEMDGATKNMSKGLKHSMAQHYQQLGNDDDEDDTRMLVPEAIIPKSTPWVATYRELGPS